MLNWKFGMDIGLEDLTWEVYCSWIDSEVGRLIFYGSFNLVSEKCVSWENF